MKKAALVFLVIIFLINSKGVFSQDTAGQARFLTVTGTVEIQEQGSSRWTPASEGDLVKTGTIISTGFKSSAALSLGNSSLTIRPLTRLSLEEIVRMENTEKVSLNLRTGRVRAEVTPPAGGKTDFSIHTPSATASVRGTIFEFDTLELSVENGRVQYSGINGQTIYVDQGEWTYVDVTENRVVPPFETATSLLTPVLPELSNTSSGNNSGGKTSSSSPVLPVLTGDMGVGVEWP
jgi:hypothetical protein